MATDQEIIDASAKARADLHRDVAERVPRGDEKSPPPRVDPNALRKAMYKMSNEGYENLGDARDDASGALTPEQVAAAEAEASGRGAPAVVKVASTDAGQAAPKYVTIQAEGGTIQVAQSDVDREGSVELYLRRRAIDDAIANDKATIARLQAELAESRRVRQEQLQAQPAGQAGPASGSARPAERSLPGSGASDEEMGDLASRLAQKIYSGDEAEARGAILEILKRSSARGEVLSAADIESRVHAAVAQAQHASPPAATTAQPSVATVNPRFEAINAQINEMAAREYEDVCKDDVARTATFSYFQKLIQLPENRDRRAVDVARDACEWGRTKFTANPRGRIVEQKRGLQSATGASGATQTAADDAEPTPSSIVEQMREFRNFGRKAH